VEYYLLARERSGQVNTIEDAGQAAPQKVCIEAIEKLYGAEGWSVRAARVPAGGFFGPCFRAN
jgi:hypothetical protein